MGSAQVISGRIASIGSHVYVTDAETVVRRVYSNSKCFEVKLVCTKVQHRLLCYLCHFCDCHGSFI